jgi:putative endonuclease
MSNLRRIGRSAEDQAAKYLLQKGYTILTRRYTSRFGEIDLIALEGEVLVFVEVKFRKGKAYKPEEAVDPCKALKIQETAFEYLSKQGIPEHAIRFDVIAIDPDGLRHYKDAFR